MTTSVNSKIWIPYKGHFISGEVITNVKFNVIQIFSCVLCSQTIHMLQCKGNNLISSFEMRFTWNGIFFKEIILTVGFDRERSEMSFKSIQRLFTQIWFKSPYGINKKHLNFSLKR